MSITDELREYIHREMWDLPKWKDELRPIVDRIDAEVADKQAFCDRLHEAAKNREEVTLWGVDYVALPVGADGVPIHVGDILNPPAGCDDYMPLQVVRLTYDGYEEEWYFDGEAGGFTGMVGECMDIAGWTHHHPRTVEDVLREFTDAILEWAGKSGTVAEVGFWSEVAAEYIAKLQLKEE